MTKIYFYLTPEINEDIGTMLCLIQRAFDKLGSYEQFNKEVFLGYIENWLMPNRAINPDILHLS